MKFPYTKYPTGTGSIVYPTLKVTLMHSDTRQTFPNYVVLVDSGAAECVFHAGIGEAVGIDIRSGEEVPLKGVVGSPGKQFRHRVILVLGGHEVELVAGFSYELSVPFGLLGQSGFFEKFRICFDLPKGDFEIVPKG